MIGCIFAFVQFLHDLTNQNHHNLISILVLTNALGQILISCSRRPSVFLPVISSATLDSTVEGFAHGTVK